MILSRLFCEALGLVENGCYTYNSDDGMIVR